MIRAYRGIVPKIAASAYIDPSAQVIGDVAVGERSSIWPNVTARGDVHSIRIERSDTTGYTRLIAKQNDTVLSFMLDEDDCLYIAGLLTGAPLLLKV